MTAKSLKIKATRMPRAQVNIAFLNFRRKSTVKSKITIFDVKARINQVVCRSKYGASTVVIYQRKVFEMRVAVGVYIIENQYFKEFHQVAVHIRRRTSDGISNISITAVIFKMFTNI